MVLRRGTELTAAGVVAGLLGAAALTRVMASLLFGVSTTDVMTFSIVPVILIVTALLATYIPALRATRVDPTDTLPEERRLSGSELRPSRTKVPSRPD